MAPQLDNRRAAEKLRIHFEPSQIVIVYGLRGNLFRSANASPLGAAVPAGGGSSDWRPGGEDEARWNVTPSEEAIIAESEELIRTRAIEVALGPPRQVRPFRVSGREWNRLAHVIGSRSCWPSCEDLRLTENEFVTSLLVPFAQYEAAARFSDSLFHRPLRPASTPIVLTASLLPLALDEPASLSKLFAHGALETINWVPNKIPGLVALRKGFEYTNDHHQSPPPMTTTNNRHQ